MVPRARFMAAFVAASILSLGSRAALAQGEDPQPVVSASSEGDSTISGVPDEDVLWDQTYDCSDLGVGSALLTDFGIDTEGADDFVVPAGMTWDIAEVQVKGFYFPFHGPASTVDLVIYEDDGGLPGMAVASFLGLTPVAGLDTGNFVLAPPSDLILGPGRYWLSVKATMKFLFEGQWFWRVRHDATELERVFRNPDDFYHTGCTEFDQASDCGILVGLLKPDHCFRILGVEVEDCADLAVVKTASTDRVPVDGRLTYFIEVTNYGPADAVDVELVDAVPDELSIEGVRRPAGWTSTVLSDVLRAQTPLLIAGTTVTFEIEVEARSSDQSIVNTASVTSATVDCDPSNNEDEATIRIHALSDPSIPTLSELGLALLVLLMGTTLYVYSARRA